MKCILTHTKGENGCLCVTMETYVGHEKNKLISTMLFVCFSYVLIQFERVNRPLVLVFCHHAFW